MSISAVKAEQTDRRTDGRTTDTRPIFYSFPLWTRQRKRITVLARRFLLVRSSVSAAVGIRSVRPLTLLYAAIYARVACVQIFLNERHKFRCRIILSAAAEASKLIAASIFGTASPRTRVAAPEIDSYGRNGTYRRRV